MSKPQGSDNGTASMPNWVGSPGIGVYYGKKSFTLIYTGDGSFSLIEPDPLFRGLRNLCVEHGSCSNDGVPTMNRQPT